MVLVWNQRNFLVKIKLQYKILDIPNKYYNTITFQFLLIPKNTKKLQDQKHFDSHMKIENLDSLISNIKHRELRD